MSEAVHKCTSFSEAPPQVYHNFLKDSIPVVLSQRKVSKGAMKYSICPSNRACQDLLRHKRFPSRLTPGPSHLFHSVLTCLFRHAHSSLPRDEGKKQAFTFLHP